MNEPTDRQFQVLVAYIEAGSARAAALRLGVHPDSIRHVLADLNAVLGAANTAQAFAIAVRSGLIDAHDLSLPDAA